MGKLINHLSIGLVILSSSSVHAITIDDFRTSTRVTVSELSDAKRTSSFINFDDNSHVVGGSRSVTAAITSVKTAGTNRDVYTELYAQGDGLLALSSQLDVESNLLIAYDGDNKVGLTNFNGLGGINLLADGATAFVASMSYDKPVQRSTTVEVTVYDAADITGQKYSRGFFELDRDTNFLEEFRLDFAKMTLQGAHGAANLTNVGAMTFLLQAVEATDFALDFIKTNGSGAPGSAVPEPGSLFLLGMGAFLVRRKSLKA